MKLSFAPLDPAQTTFHASVSTEDEQVALSAFDAWCEAQLPAPGEHWSRIEHQVHLRDRRSAADARRVVVVFSDHALARKFRTNWI